MHDGVLVKVEGDADFCPETSVFFDMVGATVADLRAVVIVGVDPVLTELVAATFEGVTRATAALSEETALLLCIFAPIPDFCEAAEVSLGVVLPMEDSVDTTADFLTVAEAPVEEVSSNFVEEPGRLSAGP